MDHYWYCKYQTALFCSSASLKWNLDCWFKSIGYLQLSCTFILCNCYIRRLRKNRNYELQFVGFWDFLKMWLLKQLHLDSRAQSSFKRLVAFQFLIPVKPVFLKCLLLVSPFPFEYGQIRNRHKRLLTNVVIIPFYILASLRVPSVLFHTKNGTICIIML